MKRVSESSMGVKIIGRMPNRCLAGIVRGDGVAAIGEKRRPAKLPRRPSTPEAITRLISAVLLEWDNERAVQGAQHMTLKTIAETDHDGLIKLPPQTA
ncbi:MAG: hypothetical protein V1267_07315 [Alphaproteobacteria bacterium]|nr:hypothetical protein [Alphaproteobacteria bacterium]